MGNLGLRKTKFLAFASAVWHGIRVWLAVLAPVEHRADPDREASHTLPAWLQGNQGVGGMGVRSGVGRKEGSGGWGKEDVLPQ